MNKDDLLMPDKDYKVLIKCMTYNQEKYIEDALKGFVRQKTNFPYCALVVDDCSTDGTAEIIKKYEAEYPEIIKGIYLPVNMYRNPEKQKYIQPWQDCAQYIAKCEGDDYWIDDYKLQRQVDFLDSHPDYMMHFHNAIVRFDNHLYPDRIMSNYVSGDFSTKQIFEKWQLPYASILFRKELYNSSVYRDLRKKGGFGVSLFIAATRLGKVYGLSECLSVYRKNDGGVSYKIPSSSFIEAEYGFAKISGEPAAIRIMNKRTAKVLYGKMPSILKFDKEAWKFARVVFKYSYYPFFVALLKFIVTSPCFVLRWIKYRIKRNK